MTSSSPSSLPPPLTLTHRAHSTMNAFVVREEGESVEKAQEWYPFRARIRCTRSTLMRSLAEASNAVQGCVSAIVHESDDVHNVFVYGQQPVETFLRSLPISNFQEIHVERQSALMFELTERIEADKARSIERNILKGTLVNAAVVDRKSRSVCVFAPENVALGVVDDELIASFTVEWAVYDAMTGKPHFPRNLVDSGAQFLGLYPVRNNRLALSRVERELKSVEGITAIKIGAAPPSVQVYFDFCMHPKELFDAISEKLRPIGFSITLRPARVLLSQTSTVRVLSYSTELEDVSGDIDMNAMASFNVATLRQGVTNIFRQEGVVAVEAELHTHVFHVGRSRCRICWRSVKQQLDGIDDIYAAFVDFTASKLIVQTATKDAWKAILRALKRLQWEATHLTAPQSQVGTPYAQQAQPVQQESPEEINSELEHAFEWRREWRTGSPTVPSAPSRAQDVGATPTIVGAVSVPDMQCPHCAEMLEDIVMMKFRSKGVVAIASEVSQQRILLRYPQTNFTLDDIVGRLQSVGWPARVLPHDESLSVALTNELQRLSHIATNKRQSVVQEGRALLAHIDPRAAHKKPLLDAQHYEGGAARERQESPKGLANSKPRGYEPVVTMHVRARREMPGDSGLTDSFNSFNSASASLTDSFRMQEAIYLSLYRAAPSMEEEMDEQTKSETPALAQPEIDRSRSRTYGGEGSPDRGNDAAQEDVKPPTRPRARSAGSRNRDRQEFFLVLSSGGAENAGTGAGGDDDQRTTVSAPAATPATGANEPLYYFDSTWVFWFDITPPGRPTAQQFEDNLQRLGEFETVQGFWRYWNNLDVANLKDWSNLRLFRKNIRPVCEDPTNAEGGRWIARGLDRRQRYELWSSIVLAMVGETLWELSTPMICGLVMSTKPTGDVLQLWTDGTTDRVDEAELEAMGKRLTLLLFPDSNKDMFRFERHKDTYMTPTAPRVVPPAVEPARPHDDTTLPPHAQDFIKRIPQTQQEVYRWLLGYNLEEYFHTLVDFGFDDLPSILSLTQNDLVEMGFKLGHQKRFLTHADQYRHVPTTNRNQLYVPSIPKDRRSISDPHSSYIVPPAGGLGYQHGGHMPPVARIGPGHGMALGYQHGAPPGIIGEPMPHLAHGQKNERKDLGLSAAEQEDAEEKRRLGLRELKNAKEWRAVDWSTVPEEVREELWERMEERLAVELTDESVRTLQAAFPIPNPEWQTLAKFIFLRAGHNDETYRGFNVGDQVSLVIDGIGANPRLLALRVAGIASEYGSAVAHVVMYKSNCTRQEESQCITRWDPPDRVVSVKGIIQRVWRIKQQKRNAGKKKKKALDLEALQHGGAGGGNSGADMLLLAQTLNIPLSFLAAAAAGQPGPQGWSVQDVAMWQAQSGSSGPGQGHGHSHGHGHHGGHGHGGGMGSLYGHASTPTPSALLPGYSPQYGSPFENFDGRERG